MTNPKYSRNDRPMTGSAISSVLTCIENAVSFGRAVCHACMNPFPSTAINVLPFGLNRTRTTRSWAAKLVVDTLPANDPAVDGNTFLHRY